MKKIIFIILAVFFISLIFLPKSNPQKNISKNSSLTFQENKKIKILFGGDLMMDRRVKKSVKENFEGNYLKLFEKYLNYFNNFDYVVLNLEGPISNRGTKIGSKYSFRMEPEIIEALKNANLKVFNLANNHIFDYGKEAFDDTLKILKENEFFFFGVGQDEISAYAPLILEKYGNKVGILGFSQFLEHLKAKNSPGIAFLEEEIFERKIKEAKRIVDILIVVFHWGNEYEIEPTENQKYFAHKAIDLGADLVVGHHPHVVQKIEKYKEKLIFYSLGNFTFDQDFSEQTTKGGLVELEIEDKRIKEIYFRWLYLNEKFQIEKISDKLMISEIEGNVYKLRIAKNPQEWEKGLMFVKKPLDYDGMIFIFPEKQVRYFWNKNTFVDLKLYWLDGKEIIGKDFLPSIEKTKTILVVSSKKPVNGVIEIIK